MSKCCISIGSDRIKGQEAKTTIWRDWALIQQQVINKIVLFLFYHVQKERESFFAGHTPDGGRIISLSHQAEEASTEQQVQLLHGALRQCLGLIHCVIQKEDEEWGEEEGDYDTMRKSVKVRLEHLLYTTKDLAETDETLEVTPDHICSEVEE